LGGGGREGDGIERPTAKSWLHLKGFTMLAQENVSTSGLVAPQYTMSAAITVLYYPDIILAFFA